MIGRVAALVVLVALAGCEARSVDLDDDSLGTLSRTEAPVPAIDVLFRGDHLASALTKAASSTCRASLAQISVPAGGSLTIASPISPSVNSSACVWNITTVPGYELNLKCQSFSLGKENVFFVLPFKNGNYSSLYSYVLKNFPTIEPGVQSSVLYFKFYPRGYTSSFSCTVTTRPRCRCGIVKRSTRIVGGVNTEVREYPWQVALFYGSRNIFCGATLISDRHIATATHCVTGLTTSSFQLLLGGHTRTKPTASEIIVKPLRIIPHPQYGVNTTFNNDIAIIEIAPLDFYNPLVLARPICLPDSPETYVGVKATSTGWGRLSTNGTQPDILQELDVYVVSNANCSTVYGSVVTNAVLCTSNVGQKGTCFGDSGGPLIARDGANYELIGVSSFTAKAGCAIGIFYSGFARVTALMSWIQANTNTSTTCGR